MAKSLLSVRKVKKPKVTRSEAYMVNLKYLGDEPKVVETKVDVIKAFNWYNSMCTKEEARQYLRDYFANDGGMIKLINSIPDKWLPLTTAWQCRIIKNKGAIFDLEASARVCAKIQEAASHTKTDDDDEESPQPKAAKPSIQERMKDRLSDIIGDIEVMLDEGGDIDLYSWLQKSEIPAMYVPKIVDYYTPLLEEYSLGMEGDPAVMEGYRGETKKTMRAKCEKIMHMINDANRYGNVTKKTRSVRKPRPVSIEKQLKGLKYQKESNEYKLASVDPQTIIGAQELWTFNSKYGHIAIFRALDRGGLKVKGTSITGYDDKQSFSYKTGRKTGSVVDQFNKSTKAGVKKVVSDLKPNTFNPRINENTILLKVIK